MYFFVTMNKIRQKIIFYRKNRLPPENQESVCFFILFLSIFPCTVNSVALKLISSPVL